MQKRKKRAHSINRAHEKPSNFIGFNVAVPEDPPSLKLQRAGGHPPGLGQHAREGALTKPVTLNVMGRDSAPRCPRRRAKSSGDGTEPRLTDDSPLPSRPLGRGRGRRSAPSLPPTTSPAPSVRRRNRTTADGRLTTSKPPAGTRAETAQRAVPTSNRVPGTERQATEPNHG